MTDTNTDTDTNTTETPANQTQPYDLAIIGGGPAGCSAGVFAARAGLETVCFEHERSSLLKSAHLENFLGFPFGIQPTQFLTLAREHLREAGCGHRRETVLEVTQAAGSESGDDVGSLFTIETDTDTTSYTAKRVLVASWARTSFLEPLPLTRESEEPGPVMVIPTDADGRTDCEGVYAAGRITSQHHQAIVNAGNGAHVALTIIRELRPEYYNDWVVPEGYYDYYDREVPDGVEEIPIDERRRRKARASERMAAFFDEE